MKLLFQIAILPIRIYQVLISPISPATCRYSPTCSSYAIEAIKEWGIVKGWIMALKRILSCHPWGGKGYDPVPKKETI
jgi:putative membrane protein insertion efficiency factor